jgi:hypothetical protein
MRSKITILFSEAAHRRGFSRAYMIDLSLPLHIDWMGGLTPAAYLDRLVSLGITAVELQLPPTLRVHDLAAWTTLAAQASTYQLKLAIHAPIPAESAIWADVVSWLAQLGAANALTLVVHGCTAARPHAGLAAQTITHVRSLLTRLPSTLTIAIEQGWNWGTMIRPGAVLRDLHNRWLKQRLQRPTGVGRGMGAEPATAAQPISTTDTVFDPQLHGGWRRMLHRTGGFSGTGTREETLQVVMEVSHPNCIIAWDVAHDWLGGAKGGVAGWRSTPSPDFLSRVGYVRLHDADDAGRDHWPLVIGNVPYASQLRPLLHHGFVGTVCLAIRYTPSTGAFGDRWHVLERSLAVARQVLRLNYSSNP